MPALETVKIVNLENLDDYLVINESDYDPKKHVLLADKAEYLKALAAHKAKAAGASQKEPAPATPVAKSPGRPKKTPAPAPTVEPGADSVAGAEGGEADGEGDGSGNGEDGDDEADGADSASGGE